MKCRYVVRRCVACSVACSMACSATYHRPALPLLTCARGEARGGQGWAGILRSGVEGGWRGQVGGEAGAEGASCTRRGITYRSATHMPS